VSRDEREVRGWEKKALGGTERRAVPLSLDLTLEEKQRPCLILESL
jgi:hypothetical protein